MTTFTYDTLATAAGTDLGHSHWIDINQERINAFAEITGDRQWIHVDPERAAYGPFGTTIAHGYLTLSLVAGFLDEVFHLDGIAMSINYGTDRVRFPHPVTVGSRVRGHGEIVGVIPVSTGLQTTVRMTVEINDAERPACVTDILIRVIPTENAPKLTAD
ncbi:MaoC family dehydratase [Rhodococcus qingshengii]|uniref:MaoC family dehydratase n=1 Tax=Rhodococcus qingshengii TaxID=334542 RepID=UPI001BECB9CF|nr:MaoC family dehydratase [Rhodococcus qingshengii]MBT2269948.1 MaoC family dehydratase [Rhodococcus qingshengii]